MLYVNRHCKKVFTRDPVGEKCYKILHGFDKPCDPCVNELLMEDLEKPHYREYYNPVLKRHFMAHDRMIKWPDGRNVHFELAVDITDRKRFEEELTKERDFAESLVATANVIILVLDVKGRILLFNPYLENISGYKIDEVKGKDWFTTFLPERDIEKIEGVFYKAITEDRIRDNVNPIVTKDGRELMIEWNSRTLKDAEGNIIGVLNVGEDISERLKVEEEIKKHQEHLEELVIERTKQLEETQAELVIKERLAVLGQLVAVVSHEIRNPLGTIASSIFTIKERTKDADIDLHLPVERIKRSISRCDGIIEELLYYTRKRDIELKSEHIDKWIDDILLESEIPPGIQLIRKSGCDFKIEMDSEKIRRCLVNLIDNAVQAIDEKNRNLAPPDMAKAAITVETTVSDGKLEISVEDTGSGISEENLKIIFEPLYSTKNFGVGLGLSIIKQIIEQHGGGIKLESQIGVGTKATLWLPVKDR
jgi:PAS domain S-box-containing protein